MTEETNPNFVQSIIKEFLEILDYAKEKLGDDKVRQQVLSDLGLKTNSNALIHPEDPLENVRKFTEKVDPDLEAFESAFVDILNILKRIRYLLSFSGSLK